MIPTAAHPPESRGHSSPGTADNVEGTPKCRSCSRSWIVDLGPPLRSVSASLLVPSPRVCDSQAGRVPCESVYARENMPNESQRQVAFGQLQDEVPGVLNQTPTGLEEPLLQTRQRGTLGPWRHRQRHQSRRSRYRLRTAVVEPVFGRCRARKAGEGRYEDSVHRGQQGMRRCPAAVPDGTRARPTTARCRCRRVTDAGRCPARPRCGAARPLGTRHARTRGRASPRTKRHKGHYQTGLRPGGRRRGGWRRESRG